MDKLYKIYNLELDTKEFEFQSFVFRRVKSYENRIKNFYKPKRLTTNYRISTNPPGIFPAKKRIQRRRIGDHVHTFDAMPKYETSKESGSIFVKNGKEIHDILILFSLMTGRSVCLNDNKIYTDHRVFEKILYKNEYRSFLENYLKQKLTEDKLLRMGLRPAVFYYLNSRYPYPIDIKFFLNWICLEIFANTYSALKGTIQILPTSVFKELRRKIESDITALHSTVLDSAQAALMKKNIQNLNVYSTGYRVLFLLRNFGLVNRITDKIIKKRIKDWNKIRGKLIHTGLILDDKFLSDVVDVNFLIHDVLTVIIYSLLGTQSFINKSSILQDVQLHFKRGGYRTSWNEKDEPKFEVIKLKKT